MDVKTYRAKTLQEALNLVRRELGPQASILHTRDVRGAGGLLSWLQGNRLVEVTASATVQVPSRLPQRTVRPQLDDEQISRSPTALQFDYRQKFREDLKTQIDDLHSMVEELCRLNKRSAPPELPESLFHLFADLIEAEVTEELARQVIDRLRRETPASDLADPLVMKSRLSRLIESQIRVAGPIQVVPGQCRVVALVGPTGVGKTTTVAKLAANFRLREKKRVGLVTVDTYRIAAVEQLRTYADIIDLPMEVVSTPREMRAAVVRLSELDLILMDTAGRSPKDDVRIQELKSMLAEAQPDEVHLVLSSVGSSGSLTKAAECFADVGTTALVLTKLDEASSLGNVLSLLSASQLPLSYLTDGQNVPDDIKAAESARLTRMILKTDP